MIAQQSMPTSVPRSADAPTHSLTIVIPALNEEEAIGSTISRCLAAREQIINTAPVASVEIIVVSDGSTDRTAEIAQSFRDVKVIVFERNQGYGAAIKEGWRTGAGSLLAFLDADGTCDPLFLAPMCRVCAEENADVVLGSRLGPDSHMPRIRRLGNRIFALILGFLCGRHVTDTASGMRVVRRTALRDLLPLPNGLHFTPSMSARAMLNNLRVIELPMSYEERVGRSKLSVIRDGVRFLKTIISGVLCYNPEKPFLMAFAVCVALMAALALYPSEFYLQHRRLEEWMIYRFVACYLLGSFALMLLCATAAVHQMAFFSRRRRDANTFWPPLIAAALKGPTLLVTSLFLACVAVVFLWPGITEYLTSRTVHLHWSRLIAGAFALSSLLQTLVFSILLKVITIWKEQLLASGPDE